MESCRDWRARVRAACVASGIWRRGCPYLSPTRSRTCSNPKNRGRHQPGRKRTPQLAMRQALDEVCAGGKLPRLAGARARCVRRERDLAARLPLPLPNTIQDLQQPQEPRQTPTRQKTDPAVNSSAENSSRQQSRDCVCFLRDPEAARGAIFSSKWKHAQKDQNPTPTNRSPSERADAAAPCSYSSAARARVWTALTGRRRRVALAPPCLCAGRQHPEISLVQVARVRRPASATVRQCDSRPGRGWSRRKAPTGHSPRQRRDRSAQQKYQCLPLPACATQQPAWHRWRYWCRRRSPEEPPPLSSCLRIPLQAPPPGRRGPVAIVSPNPSLPIALGTWLSATRPSTCRATSSCHRRQRPSRSSMTTTTSSRLRTQIPRPPSSIR